MKELEFINIIKKLTQSSYIGDDCAFLKDLNIVVTQDNFIEDVHFKREWATPYQIGYKAAAVNISDILASGAKPAYISVGLSAPNNIDNDYIKELYKGICAGSYGAKIIGGDITGADKLFISITAIGKTEGRKISSRSNAKSGYVVISHDKYGQSARGLEELKKGIKNSDNIIAHLEPKLEPEFSEAISCNIKEDYAMMDTSDGLADALYKIAEASKVTIVSDNIEGMFGFEDYHLVAAVPKSVLKYINNYFVIGKVIDYDGSYLNVNGTKYNNYNQLNTYNHFMK